MKDTIKDIWVNHRNELIKFLEEKGQGIYDEALLEASIEEEKKELLDKVIEFLKTKKYQEFAGGPLVRLISDDILEDLKMAIK